jgi:hypothetical protein
MLFTTKINDVQSAIESRLDLISSLEAQIEALRQENLEQQQFLQALGSAEAAAESALTQVQTAIAMVNAVDPEQLETFKNAVLAAFNGNAPILPPDTDPSGPADDAEDDDNVVEVDVEVQPSDDDEALEIAMSFTTHELKARLQGLGHQSPKGNKRTLAQLLVDEWKKQGGQVSAENDYPMAA